MKLDFRAWDKTRNEIVDVMDIDFSIKEVGVCNVPKRELDGRLHTIHSVKRDWDEVELMRSTGAKDRKGIEVFLNDIVEDEYGYRYEVVFEGDCLRCNGLRINAGGHRPKNRWFGKDLEVIGNRYETPELLEVEKWK